jgi:hypothetical protein
MPVINPNFSAPDPLPGSSLASGRLPQWNKLVEREKSLGSNVAGFTDKILLSKRQPTDLLEGIVGAT